MLEQIEGSQAVARAVARCRPEVIAAYPISPQTHIVEGLSDLVRTGELQPCEYLMVESEFGALSAAIGASAAGARTYTATASQGILYMAEALFNASGLGLPIVMTGIPPINLLHAASPSPPPGNLGLLGRGRHGAADRIGPSRDDHDQDGDDQEHAQERDQRREGRGQRLVS
jgi:hypothetical protein